MKILLVVNKTLPRAHLVNRLDLGYFNFYIPMLELGHDVCFYDSVNDHRDFEKLVEVTGYRTGEAHNDYMSVRYNYGYVGLSLLLAGFVFTFIFLLKIFRYAGDQNYLWLMTASVLPLFFGFLMFMYTDNILKYTIYFPNYFFTLIGIISSVKKDEDYSSYSAVQ